MALEYITSIEIVSSEKIEIPSNANYYKLKSGAIRFFCVNSFSDKLSEIPECARQIVFEDYVKHMHWINYGEPAFFDLKGNILKLRKREEIKNEI